ncbi:MAG: prolyl oligopeptidase family serine peptidase, partial [Gemmatimonadetes bacterium]|nr:prolyl oligopeptidase family serine peptidase [Gemmatimonadota bacterium]
APDVYHVGVAGGGRQNFGTSYFLGPLGENSETREHASNLRLADNLRGKLLLLHGTGDVNSPLAQTMQLVDAFIQAGKPYDLQLFPEKHHLFLLRPGKARSYFRDAISRYFREHLKP